MPLRRLPLLAAALLLLAGGAARAESVTITGGGVSPLTTTDGASVSVPNTRQQTFNNGLSVSGSNGVAVIGLGPLPTSCAGLQPGTPYDNGGSSPAICRNASYVALNSGGRLLLNSGGALLLNQ